MGDEIRITVIATGFDSQASVSIPKPKAVEATAVAHTKIPFVADDLPAVENLDVPTFMRRHAD
jgi:cell division GTPase FtsZ